MGAAAERRDDVRSTGRGPLNWRRGVLMAWGRDDKVGGLKARAGLILEAQAEVLSWAMGMLEAIAEGELLCG